MQSWVKRHHLTAATLAASLLLVLVMLVGEPESRQTVSAETVSVSVSQGQLAVRSSGESAQVNSAGNHLTVYLSPIELGDGRGTGDGWVLLLSLVVPGSSGGRARAPLVEVRPILTVRNLGGLNQPRTYGGRLTTGGTTIAKAEHGLGMGSYRIRPILSIVHWDKLRGERGPELTIAPTIVSSH